MLYQLSYLGAGGRPSGTRLRFQATKNYGVAFRESIGLFVIKRHEHFTMPKEDEEEIEAIHKLPASGYTIKVSDINGRVLFTQNNNPIVNAVTLASGAYNLELTIGDEHYTVKAIKK